MSQAILISNNEVINHLYEVNLRAYVATNVTIKKSFESAVKLIEQSPNIDVVICFGEVNKSKDVIGAFQNYLSDKDLSIPLIILGETKKTYKNSITIKNKYDIKRLLQSLAKILEVSAKEMSQYSVPDFFPIPIKLLSSIETSHCDIFYRSQKENFDYEYFKIIETDTMVGDSLKRYIDEGVAHLYIDADERLRFINKASGVIVSELERDDLSSEERVEITAQGMGIVAEQMFEDEAVSEEIAQISMACVQSITQVVKSVPKLKGLLAMLLENQSDIVYKHSILATYVASNLIKNISWGSAEQISKVSFALFFHDLFLIPIFKKYPDAISEEDLLFRDDITEEDKQVVLDHARLAGQMVKTFPRCPMGADMIITQHHGMTSGQGFAINFKDDVSPLSKIMIIAEDITMYILIKLQAGDKKNLINKEEMIERLSEKYRNHTYRKIIEALRLINF